VSPHLTTGRPRGGRPAAARDPTVAMVEATVVAVAEREGGGSASSPSPGGEELSRREENERENTEEWGMREVRTGVLHEGDKAGVGGAAPRAPRF
jgi:hypothetical protein